MRIAQLAPPFLPIPPDSYGGTERVIAVLTEELVRRGHDVTLFASADSQTSATLVPTVERAAWRVQPPLADPSLLWSVVLGRLARHRGELDVIHSHLDVFGLPLARFMPCPVVTTLHGRLDLREVAMVFGEFGDAPVVSISDAQRRPLPQANWVGTVYNGVELDQLTFSPEADEYLLFLGRISPDKGVDAAIRVARRAGWPLKIGARLPLPFSDSAEAKSDWKYYEEAVRPLLEGRDVEFVGQVAGPRRDALLRNAAALLFPIQWPEPFGLVMAEALASGTPVLALCHGSVPEVIEHGVTGFICQDIDEMTQMVGRLGEIDRSRCRAEAERRFSPAAMADGYEQVYQRLIRGVR